MKGFRLAFFSLLISLPAVLIVGIGGYFILTEIPRAVRREVPRINGEYRDVAEDLVAHPEKAIYVGPRMKGWSPRVSKINGRVWGVYTGAGEDADVSQIWFQSGDAEYRAVEVPRIRPFPYELVFYGGGLAVSAVLLGLTMLAVLYFVRYVKSRDDFLAATAHDLTTPLVGMRMMIGRADDEAKRLNERMLLIVSNIKDFLKLGGRRRQPDLKPVDIVALTKEAYELFAADYADSESGEVVFSVPDGAAETAPPQDKVQDKAEGRGRLAPVSVDETMALQILWNLFGNDLKYAAPYGKVSVRFVQEGGFVKIEFADEGQGMTPRQMKRAFDRYYRARTVLESGKGGFGIGLCTAREFARAMGGDLTVCANDPKGCIFTLSLPKRP